MYIWLNEKGKKQLKKRTVGNYPGDPKKEQEFLGDVRIETHESSGRKYFNSYDNPMDPTACDPNIPQDFIEKITFKETIHCGFRIEGFYRHGEAVLVVRSHERMADTMETIEREKWQEISVSAPSFAALRAIYTTVRQGKLLPEENWEAKQLAVKPAEEPKAPASAS